MTEEELLAGIGEMDAGGGGLDLSALMPALPQRTPPTPPGPQVPSGRQQVLGSVLAALPMILRGGNGGPVAAAAFMQGMQQARLQKQQQVNQGYVQDRQAFQDQRALDVDAQTQAYRTAQLSAAQQRAEASRQDALVKEFAAALDKAESPEAIDALTGFYGSRLPQMSDRLSTFAAPFKAPTRVNRKRAEKQIATLEKTYGQDWALKLGEATHVLPGAEMDPATGQPRRISTQELLAMAGTNVQGLPQKPANPRPPAALGSFEDYVQRLYGENPTAAQIETARKRYQQADDKPRAGDSMGDVRRFNMEQKLVTQWDKARSSEREMERQYGLMETGLRRFDADPNGASQAVLVTFQKILDPTSVVRESEYARSASGISLLSRMEGYADRLSRGGAGVPKAELAAMVKTAREFLEGARSGNKGLRSRIQRTAADYKLDPRMIFDDPDTVQPSRDTPREAKPNPFRGNR